jgi:hypothetical protein
MQVEHKAAALKFPVSAADSTALTGVARYASATSNTSVALPSLLRGRFVRVVSVGVNTRVSVSIGAHTLVYNTNTNLGTGSTASGATCASGGSIEGIIPGDCTYINFISDNTGGTVEIFCTELNNLTKAANRNA